MLIDRIQVLPVSHDMAKFFVPAAEEESAFIFVRGSILSPEIVERAGHPPWHAAVYVQLPHFWFSRSFSPTVFVIADNPSKPVKNNQCKMINNLDIL